MFDDQNNDLTNTNPMPTDDTNANMADAGNNTIPNDDVQEMPESVENTDNITAPASEAPVENTVPVTEEAQPTEPMQGDSMDVDSSIANDMPLPETPVQDEQSEQPVSTDNVASNPTVSEGEESTLTDDNIVNNPIDPNEQQM